MAENNKKMTFQKLKKKLLGRPKRELREERDDLTMEQAILRKKVYTLREHLDSLMRSYQTACKANDTKMIEQLDPKINRTREKIDEYKKQYKENYLALKVYSEILKNDKEGTAVERNSWFGALGTVSGVVLGGVGLRAAYKTDIEGRMINKGTHSWFRDIPNIIRNFGRHGK